jgi:hypothetical protein
MICSSNIHHLDERYVVALEQDLSEWSSRLLRRLGGLRDFYRIVEDEIHKLVKSLHRPVSIELTVSKETRLTLILPSIRALTCSESHMET